MEFEFVECEYSLIVMIVVCFDYGDLFFIRGDARRRFIYVISARYEDVFDVIVVFCVYCVSFILCMMYLDGYFFIMFVF